MRFLAYLWYLTVQYVSLMMAVPAIILSVILYLLAATVIGFFLSWVPLIAFTENSLTLDNYLKLSIFLGTIGLCWLVALVILWGQFAPLLSRNRGEKDAHGSARFADRKEATELTKSSSGLLIGRDQKTGRFLHYDGPSHLLTMAPTRTGKGVGTIIPNLLVLDRSIICIDPKGENASVTARTRQTFGPVFVLDPFSATDQESTCFNPLDGFDIDGLDVAEDASSLADALVHDEPGAMGEAHWNEEAKALIGGVILYVVASEPRATRTLSKLRECLTLAPEAFTLLLSDMQSSNDANGLIARAANRHLGKSDREAAGVLSAAQRHTHFLDSPRMTKVLSRSDFKFEELKQRPATIFLVLPPDRMGTYARWLRLLITQSLTDMARSKMRSVEPASNPVNNPASNPVLYLMDEFASLGHLEPIERAMGLMAGYGVQLWPILQDVHQLKSTYGTRAGTFLSNAAVLQVFGVNDHESARMVSDLLGQETAEFQTMARTLDPEKHGITISDQQTARALLTPDEVRNLPEQAELLFLAGQRPIMAQKIRYYADQEFSGLYDENP